MLYCSFPLTKMATLKVKEPERRIALMNLELWQKSLSHIGRTTALK